MLKSRAEIVEDVYQDTLLMRANMANIKRNDVTAGLADRWIWYE